MFRQRNLWLSLQLNVKISGDFRPAEQIFPETNRWVPLKAVDYYQFDCSQSIELAWNS